MNSKDIRISEQVWRTLEVVHGDALYEVTELKLALDRMRRIEGTLKNLISAVTDSRVFSALDLLEKEGEPLTDYPIDAPHSEKMLARFTSGAKFRDCVGYGYIVGRDEEARNRGYADILTFIRQIWPGPVVPSGSG